MKNLLFAAIVLISGVASADHLGSVLDAEQLWWNDDAFADTAVLVAGDESSSLEIYLSDKETGMRKLAAQGIGIVPYGGQAGDSVSLDFKKDTGALTMSYQNDVSSAHPYTKWTMAYRDGQVKVVGYTYEVYSWEKRARITCDVNLRTQAGKLTTEKDGRRPVVTEFRSQGRDVALSAWTDANIPPECEAF